MVELEDLIQQTSDDWYARRRSLSAEDLDAFRPTSSGRLFATRTGNEHDRLQNLIQHGELIGAWLSFLHPDLMAGKRKARIGYALHFSNSKQGNFWHLRSIGALTEGFQSKSPQSPDLARLARQAIDSNYSFTRLRVPPRITGEAEVYFSAVLLHPTHFPEGVVRDVFVPLLVSRPGDEWNAMVLPCRFWSEKHIAYRARIESVVRSTPVAAPKKEWDETPKSLPDELTFSMRHTAIGNVRRTGVSMAVLLTIVVVCSAGAYLAAEIIPFGAALLLALILGLLLIVLFTRTYLFRWQLRSASVTSSHFSIIGLLLSGRIPLEYIDFVQVNPSPALPGERWIRIESSVPSFMHGSLTLTLLDDEIDTCGLTLRHRCKNAIFVDMLGVRHIPKHGEKKTILAGELRRELMRANLLTGGCLLGTVFGFQLVRALVRWRQGAPLPIDELQLIMPLSLLAPFLGVLAIQSWRRWSHGRRLTKR